MKFFQKAKKEYETIANSTAVIEPILESLQEFGDFCMLSTTNESDIDLSHLDKPSAVAIEELISEYSTGMKKKCSSEIKNLLNDE